MSKLKVQPEGRQCSHCAAYFDDQTIAGAVHLASCKVYNGYTNYETWAVSLWIDNDQGLYDEWRERATEIRSDLVENEFLKGTSVTRADQVRHKLATELEQEIGGNAMDTVNGMVANLLGAALSEVDWNSLAESMLASLPDEE